MSGPLPLVIFVIGPTACGKSDLAVEACEELTKAQSEPAEIINCDSVQFFADLEIGAAKPTASQMARAVHHLVSHRPVGSEYTAGEFRRDALSVIESRHRAGVKIFFAVGGSGFYVQALEKGMYEVPSVSPEVRAQLELEFANLASPPHLYDELKTRDPEACARIHPSDRYRIFRALEILRSSPERQTLGQIRQKFEGERKPAPFRVQKIGLSRPREVLREKIAFRTRAMLDHGLIEEVVKLRGRGYAEWSPLKSVGYREVGELLDGKLKDAELESAIVTSTMQLAKRQMTWFKRDSEIRWFDPDTDWLAARNAAVTSSS